MLKNLDVTLRDGGYRNRFSFSLDYVIEHIKNLTDSRVEYIEIGYRNGPFKSMNNVGQTALCSNDYIQLLHDAIPNAKLVIITRKKSVIRNENISTCVERNEDIMNTNPFLLFGKSAHVLIILVLKQ